MKKTLLILLAFAFATPLLAQEPLQELTKEERIGRRLAQAQLDAYNNRDIDAFMEPYSDDVKIFQFPETLLYEGKEKMRDNYARYFGMTPDLHCHLVNRMVMGNTVIDQEEVTRVHGEEPTKAIAIYKIRDEKIAEVYFIK